MSRGRSDFAGPRAGGPYGRRGTAGLRMDSNLWNREPGERVRALDERDGRSSPARMTHMEKMAAIGQLSSSVAHEMRNLLGMIRTAAYNIERALPQGGGPVGKNIEIITRSVARAREFIDNLLSLSRVSTNSVEWVDLRAAADNLLVLFSKELEWRNIQLVRQYGDVPPVRADANALQECLLNLILNAIQSMENGGEIRVSIGGGDGGGVGLSIADSGCGIPEGDLDKIFDPFFTTKKNGQGTGLGLSIARSIARGFGGDIEVESAPGRGSVFTIRLPGGARARENAGAPLLRSR